MTLNEAKIEESFIKRLQDLKYDYRPEFEIGQLSREIFERSLRRSIKLLLQMRSLLD